MNQFSLGCWNVRGLSAVGRISDCLRIIKDNNLDLLCLLETKIQSDLYYCPLPHQLYNLFNSEYFVSNFDCSPGDRIWIKWRRDRLNFELISKDPQFIHGKISTSGNQSFLLTCIYADNDVKTRKLLWNSLREMAGSTNFPWIIFGDFNCPLVSKDKKGGNVVSLRNSLDFKKCLNDCELIELPSTGLYYTWFNQQVEKPIFSKLDHVLCNTQ